jgi:hypothetical protein
MITMRAMVAFDRNGKHLQVGDTFAAYPIEAASLRYQKKAEFTRQGAPQSYPTRHMTAQTPGTAPPPEAPREASQAPSQTSEAESTQTTDASSGRTRRAARGEGYSTRQIRTSKE